MSTLGTVTLGEADNVAANNPIKHNPKNPLAEIARQLSMRRKLYMIPANPTSGKGIPINTPFKTTL